MSRLITSLLPVATAAISLIKDKRKGKEGEELSLSSARITQICGGFGLIGYGINYMEKSPQYGLIIIALGVALQIGMEFFKAKKEADV
jgi:hypothetical protein